MLKQMLPLMGLVVLGMASAPSARAQAPDNERPPLPDSLIVTVVDAEAGTPLVGAAVQVLETRRGAYTNEAGRAAIATAGLPPFLRLRVRYVGYIPQEMNYALDSLPAGGRIRVVLQAEELEGEQVVIQATRSTRSIEDIPTRVEYINEEELQEKMNMRAGDITLVLRESTGIQVQQTSANTAGQVFRIHGLDGRYTQLLRDGFPLFGGFSGGLSILQIPPLDLKAFEVIKGPASTLYGGGSISGLVNLISKQPHYEPTWDFMVAGTQAGAIDMNAYYSQRWAKEGFSLYATRNSQSAYDADGEGFTDIPKFTRYTLNPTYYAYFSERITGRFALNYATERRLGGDVTAINDGISAEHPYRETSDSERLSGQVAVDIQTLSGGRWAFKQSLSWFDRTLALPDGFDFQGQQLAGFSEISYAYDGERSDWVVGGNLYLDDFMEPLSPLDTQSVVRNYSYFTPGLFVQNTTRLGFATLEAGLRTDFSENYGVFVLPRAYLLFQISPQLTTRLGGAMGYKLPTIFQEQSENRAFRQVEPINFEAVEAERSMGGTADINYRTAIGEVGLSINQLFFITQIDDPLLPDQGFLNDTGVLRYISAPGQVSSQGFETNVKFSYQDLRLMLGYSFMEVRLDSGGLNTWQPLSPRHQAGIILMYEDHTTWRIGLEAYYTDKQRLSNGTNSPAYWIAGFMVQRFFERWSIYVNLENFTDTRQTNYGPTRLGSVQNPSFVDEFFAPTDGFIGSIGIRLHLGRKPSAGHHGHDHDHDKHDHDH